MLDSHCHIDQYKNPQRIAAEAANRGVFVVAMTNLPSHFQLGLPHTRSMRNIRLAVGIHPLAADKHLVERELFRESLPQTSYVGEVGLDFSREGIATRDIQIETFRFVAECLRPLKKIVSLHSRRAEAAVLEILSEFQIMPAIFHWDSGPLNLIDEAQKSGHFFSVNPAMIQSQAGQRVIDRISPERVLTESDGPHVKIGQKQADPWHIEQVEEYLATIWQIDASEVRSRIWANFKELLRKTGVMGATGEQLPDGRSN